MGLHGKWGEAGLGLAPTGLETYGTHTHLNSASLADPHGLVHLSSPAASWFYVWALQGMEEAGGGWSGACKRKRARS